MADSKFSNNTLYSGAGDEVADASMADNDVNIYVDGADARIKYKESGTVYDKVIGLDDDWSVLTTTLPASTADADTAGDRVINVTAGGGNFTLSDSSKVDGNYYIIKDSTGYTSHEAVG